MKYKAAGRAAVMHQSTWGKAYISQYSHDVRLFWGSLDPQTSLLLHQPLLWSQLKQEVHFCAPPLQKDAASRWGSSSWLNRWLTTGLKARHCSPGEERTESRFRWLQTQRRSLHSRGKSCYPHPAGLRHATGSTCWKFPLGVSFRL